MPPALLSLLENKIVGTTGIEEAFLFLPITVGVNLTLRAPLATKIPEGSSYFSWAKIPR
jgi:hypothetical protein